MLFRSVGGGVYLAYGFLGKRKILSDIYDKELDIFKGEYQYMKPFDFGLNALVGYEFYRGFFINAGYSYGLRSIDYYDAKIKNSYFNFAVGLKF